MSMNLYYGRKTVSGNVVMEDLWPQTPTDITYEVINMKTKEEQFAYLSAWIKKTYPNPNDADYLICDIRENIFRDDTCLASM